MNTPGIPNKGEFVRVKADAQFRPGQDGLVTSVEGAGHLGMFFAFERHNRRSDAVPSVGTELWHVDELDLTTRSSAV